MGWKQDFANKAEHAIQHELVQEVINEQLLNLNRENDRLARYGLDKIAQYAATVARAEALGIDPDTLRMNADEIAESQMRLIQAANEAGKPVWIIEKDET